MRVSKGKDRVILVTGSNGFIGHHVQQRFTQAGYTVIGIDRNRATYERSNEQNNVICEITSNDLSALGIQPAVVIHCAGSGAVGESFSNPLGDFDMNVNTTAIVLDYVKRFAPDALFVLPSSAAVYGPSTVQPISTDSQLKPVSPYGVHKAIAEMLCRSFVFHFKLSCVVIRFFSIYGVGQRKLLLWDACRKIRSGKVEFYGTGEETRDFIHIEDAVSLVEMCINHVDRAKLTVINGGSGRSIRIVDVVNTICDFLGSDKGPKFLGQIRRGDPEHYEADMSEALKWGWRPKIEFKKGLREYVKWWDTNFPILV